MSLVGSGHVHRCWCHTARHPGLPVPVGPSVDCEDTQPDNTTAVRGFPSQLHRLTCTGAPVAHCGISHRCRPVCHAVNHTVQSTEWTVVLTSQGEVVTTATNTGGNRCCCRHVSLLLSARNRTNQRKNQNQREGGNPWWPTGPVRSAHTQAPYSITVGALDVVTSTAPSS